jgi:hypothetical protein
MPTFHIVRFAVVLAAGAAVVSCDKPAPDKSGVPSAVNASSQPLGGSSSAPSSSEKTASPVPAPSGSASAEIAADSVLVGTWEGRYDAKKGEVGMPPRVEDKARAKDDAKMAIGAGSISITIRKDLELEGTSEGALGTAKLRGKVDGDDVRAAFDPVDVQDKHGMFGIVSGKRKGDQIEAVIRVASGDALVVRESEIVLRRKQ